MKKLLIITLFIIGFIEVVYIGTNYSHFIAMGILALFVLLYATVILKDKKDK